MLTQRQKDVLDAIRGRLAISEVPPSFDEIMQDCGFSSKSGVHRVILALEERGYIRRLPNRARAIELIDEHDGRTKDEIIKENIKLKEQIKRLRACIREIANG